MNFFHEDTIMKYLHSAATVIGVVLSFILAGCEKDPMSGTSGNLKLSIKAMSGALAKETDAQAQQVTITSAQVVISEIEIESTSEDSLDFVSEIPLIVNLNLAGTMTQISTISVPYGTYDEIEVEICKLDTSDGQGYTTNPNLQNRTIFVSGYVEGDSNAVFTFTSAIKLEQEQEFNPPLVIDASSPNTNVVLTIDATTWFSDGAGGYLDPRLPQNQKAIERNIKASIKAFEDDDDDGKDDDHDDDHDDDGDD